MNRTVLTVLVAAVITASGATRSLGSGAHEGVNEPGVTEARLASVTGGLPAPPGPAFVVRAQGTITRVQLVAAARASTVEGTVAPAGKHVVLLRLQVSAVRHERGPAPVPDLSSWTVQSDGCAPDCATGLRLAGPVTAAGAPSDAHDVEAYALVPDHVDSSRLYLRLPATGAVMGLAHHVPLGPLLGAGARVLTGVPAELRGAWSGTVTRGRDTLRISLRLSSGPAGQVVGDVTYPGSRCGTGQVVLQDGQGAVLQLFEDQPHALYCPSGRFAVELRSDDTLLYRWPPDVLGTDAVGVLVRGDPEL